MPELDKSLQDALKEIAKSCEQEDKEIRSAMVRQWKKNEEFWHGVQYLFWSDHHDTWLSPLDMDWADAPDADDPGEFSDKVVDIFRGHGEAIIAALSAQIPALRYLPDDADEDSDVLAARTRSKVADLVQRHNKAKLIFLRALFFLALNGLVASYRYKDSDPKYGTVKVPKMGVMDQEVTSTQCKDCDSEFEGEQETCQLCGSNNLKTKKDTIQQPIPQGEEVIPKTRVKLDIFGPLHFKVSYYARTQEECTYLILFGDLGKDIVKSTYTDFADEIEAEFLEGHDRFARSEYTLNADAENKNLVTVKKIWLRPAAFYRFNEKSTIEKLLKQFPSGVRVTLAGRNNIFVDAEEEALDDRWELGKAGLSTYIHSDPILRPLVQIQEMRNDLVNLIVDTVKHGIPSEFADPAVLNFDTYGKFEASPGTVYATKGARPGEPIRNSFHTTDRATLSKEVSGFLKQLDQDAQFCVGSFPSIYGGPSEGKSRTFSEYAASRQMALQRLSIVWNFLTDWWVRTISGAVDLYIDSMMEDEHFTKFQDNNYIKVSIKRAQLTGKVGSVEPEGSETFPVSLAQQKDLLLKLMEMNNEYINQALYMPENAHILQDVMALNQFKLPGETQRIKQCIEISDLLKSGPISPEQSTVPVDQDVDDAKVHIATITAWAVDQVGLDSARENPEGYANVMAHRREHLRALIMQTLQANQTPPGEPPPTEHPPQ